jgi:hypothetical protein
LSDPPTTAKAEVLSFVLGMRRDFGQGLNRSRGRVRAQP